MQKTSARRDIMHQTGSCDPAFARQRVTRVWPSPQSRLNTRAALTLVTGGKGPRSTAHCSFCNPPANSGSSRWASGGKLHRLDVIVQAAQPVSGRLHKRCAVAMVAPRNGDQDSIGSRSISPAPVVLRASSRCRFGPRHQIAVTCRSNAKNRADNVFSSAAARARRWHCPRCNGSPMRDAPAPSNRCCMGMKCHSFL